jgi:hypothetical protein
MTGPQVSVIVPTYERRDDVCRAVASVVAQQYQEWELIVVDDGSTDGTEEALRQFGPALRYLWQENHGVSAARNAGLKLARGDIVAFLDSDDRWLPDHLEVVTGVLERHPASVLVSTTPDFARDGAEHVEDAKIVDPLPRLFVGNFIGWPSSVAVRRDVVLAAGGFDEDLEVSEDFDLFLKLALRGPFALLSRRTIDYGGGIGSLVKTGRPRGAFLDCRKRSAERLLAGLGQDRVSPKVVAQATGSLRFAEALQALHRGDDSLADLLADACRLLPELSAEPRLVVERVAFQLPGMADPAQASELLQTLAAAWPVSRSPTALALKSALVEALSVSARRREPA